MISRCAVVLLCALTALGTLAAGCSSADKPHLSGLGVGDSRVVSVGDVLTLRTPLTETGARRWRVSSYDSRYLSLTSRPVVKRDSSGDLWLVAQARGKLPGATTVEITEESASRGETPRTLRFSVRILE